MYCKLITAFLVTVAAGAASAQVAASSGSDTNAPRPDPATNQVAALPGNVTNNFQPGPALNQAGSFGLGPMIGEPLGLGMKLWLSDYIALDGGLGWSFVDPDGIQLHGDVLFHKFDLLRSDTRDLPLYIGLGGRVKFVDHGDDRAGIRFPVGIAYLMPKQRLEFYAEVAPILDFTPTTSLEWNGGVGVRFYFGR